MTPPTMDDDDRNAIVFLLRGLGDDPDATDDFRCLHFTVGFYIRSFSTTRTDLILTALREQISGYNAFVPDLIADELEPLFRDDAISTIRLGQEGSFVMYLQPNTLGLDEPAKALRRTVIEQAMERAQADELDWNGDTLRAWWD